MDINQLKKKSMITAGSCASKGTCLCLFESMVVNLLFRVMDDKVLEQITNMAQLPELVNAAMAKMPDAPIVAIASFGGYHCF